MEDDYYMSGGSEEEDDYNSSDRDAESLDGLENVPPKAPSCKVCTY